MSKADSPAFPTTLGNNYYGLTKREYFAAMAMQGLMFSGRMEFFDAEWNLHKSRTAIKAELAVAAADALLAELEKSK